MRGSTLDARIWCLKSVPALKGLASKLSQQTPDIHLMLFQCWPTVFDAGPTLKQHCLNDPCLLTVSKLVFSGIVIIPGAMGGFILGGVFAKRLDLKMRGLVCQTLATSIITIGLSFIFLIYCQQPHIAGVTVNYDWYDDNRIISHGPHDVVAKLST